MLLFSLFVFVFHFRSICTRYKRSTQGGFLHGKNLPVQNKCIALMQRLTEKRSRPKQRPIFTYFKLIEIMQVATGSVLIFWPTVYLTFDSVPISTAHNSKDFIWLTKQSCGDLYLLQVGAKNQRPAGLDSVTATVPETVKLKFYKVRQNL